MKVADFDFSLPEELIAKKPCRERDNSRLLVLRRDGGIEHRRFHDLPEYLNQGDMLLMNNTKVFPARLTGFKPTGGKIEMLLVKETAQNTWEILSRERYTGEISISEDLSAEIFDGKTARLISSDDLMEILWRDGDMPLPPYIKRNPGAMDKEWYQTVYAEKEGSIAAPTAGLHFTSELIDKIKDKGVMVRYLTLHVGTGTFRPIKAEEVEEHSMDPEYFEIDTGLTSEIRKVKDSGRRLFAVGTTTTRAIEGYFGGQWTKDSYKLRVMSYELKDEIQNLKFKEDSLLYSELRTPNSELIIRGYTDIFIYHGYKFKAVDSLITNFHLPRSTPLMLASALCGFKILMDAYNEAISCGYRFFSYGDAMLII